MKPTTPGLHQNILPLELFFFFSSMKSAGINFLFIFADSRADVLVDELAHPVAEKRLAFRKVKIHPSSSRLRRRSLWFQNGLGL